MGAQDDGDPTRSKKFDLEIEAKLDVRHSEYDEYRLMYPFPPYRFPDGVFVRTTDADTAFELSNVALIGRAELTPYLGGEIRVHVLDLHNRNPTSHDDRVFLREAWFRFGRRFEALRPLPGTHTYALIGRAPKFTKQVRRNLESYGLWGTALGRFEQDQVQLGGSFGKHVYWRAHYANRNPLFFRDPNALAGDNVHLVRDHEADAPRFETGFPILYDAMPSDATFDERFEIGTGLGFRWLRGERNHGFDVLVWRFSGELADAVDLESTALDGDLELLRAEGNPLPFSGDDKIEYGVNIEARAPHFKFFGQYVQQTIAELDRDGFEAEASFRIPLIGIPVGGDLLLRWMRLTLRYSSIDNDFEVPPDFFYPSMGWDWRKIDLGVRLGIHRNVDLTLEYSRHDMILANRDVLHPDEFLGTLRFKF